MGCGKSTVNAARKRTFLRACAGIAARLDSVTIATVAVATRLLPLPYGYYMRLFLCGVCLYFLSSVPGVREGEKWVLAGLAVLYNPLVPVELGSKPIWSIINLGTVIGFGCLVDERPE